MKKTILFALLLACASGIVKAQNSNTTFKLSTELLALNFNNTISFIPAGIVVEQSTSQVLNAEISIEKFSAIQFKYAMLMDADVEAVTNSSLYNFINDWYGTHYRMGGTTRRGIDCSAFTSTLLSSVYSFAVPRTAHEQYKMCAHLKKEELMAGDLVFFNTRGGVSHVGVYLANNHFVHSSCSNGVTISSLDDNYYAQKFIGGGRVNL